jgi:hypothetical protein
VIELGELTRDESPLPAGPMRPTRRLLRQVAASVVAVLTLFTVTGSATPVRHVVRQLWSTPYGQGDSEVIANGLLLVDRESTGTPSLSAYDLATGRMRWSSTTDTAVNGLTPVVGGVLLTPQSGDAFAIRGPGDGSFRYGTQAVATVARDAASGRVLWRQTGDERAAFSDSALLGQSDLRGRLISLRVVGLRDGVTRWTRSVPGVDSWAVGRDGDRPTVIVLADSSGTVTVLDYATGRPVSTGRVPGYTPQQLDSVVAVVQVIGGYLVISRSDNLGEAATVYQLATLQALWHTDGIVLDCGPILCTTNEAGLTGHDPTTGRARWQVPGLGFVWNLGGGRVLADSAATRGPNEILDVATGRPVGVRGESTWADTPPGPSVVVLGTESDEPNRSTIIRLDFRTGGIALLGTIAASGYYGCEGVPGYLTCIRQSNLEVTAVG